MRRKLFVLFTLAVVACSTTRIVKLPPEAAPGADAGEATRPPPVTSDDDDAPPEDAGTDAKGTTGLTPTKKTALEVTIAAKKRPIDRAQFGIDRGDAGDTFHIEAHAGGDPKCPDNTSPSPDRTLIVSGLPKGAAVGTKLTKADGVSATFLDFTDEQLTEPPFFTKATALTVTIVAVTGTTAIELEIDATFAEGTAKGRLYATFCESLSE